MATCRLACVFLFALHFELAIHLGAGLPMPAVRQQNSVQQADELLSSIVNILGDHAGKDLLYSAFQDIPSIKMQLQPMLVALPDDKHGGFEAGVVRHVLHRLFVQRHGWFVEGIDAAGLEWSDNSVSQAEVFKKMPNAVQRLVERRLQKRGLHLSEVAVLAATIEYLVHAEATNRLRAIYTTLDVSMTSAQDKELVALVTDAYMSTYVGGYDPREMNQTEILELVLDMEESYLDPSWNDTRKFVNKYVKRKAGNGQLDFAGVAEAVASMGEDYGQWQNKACLDIKSKLVTLEDKDTGRVPLSAFYDAALNKGMWEFSESKAYLRSLGALDESVSGNPRVIIPNYINSPSNCLAASEFYSVCCISECESIRSTIEKNAGGSEATPTQLLDIIVTLAPQSQSSSDLMRHRLNSIASSHHGKVPLFGRLFAQWLHHAFPDECPYPYLAGSKPSLTQEEWEEENPGMKSRVTAEEMREIISMQSNRSNGPIVYAKWTNEEELVVPTQAPGLVANAISGIMIV